MKKLLFLTLLMSLILTSCTDDKESNSSSKPNVTSDVFQSSFSDLGNESADSNVSQSIGDAYTTSISEDSNSEQPLSSESNENNDSSEDFESSNEYSEDVYDDIEESLSSSIISDSSEIDITPESSEIPASESQSEAVSESNSNSEDIGEIDDASESSQSASSSNDGWTEFY